MSASAPSSLLPDAMKVMDRVESIALPVPLTVEGVVRETYQNQGLIVDEAALSHALQETKPVAPPGPTKDSISSAHQRLDSSLFARLAIVTFTVLAIFAVGAYKLYLLPAKPAGLVLDLRQVLKSKTTDEVRDWLAQSTEGKQVTAEGHVTIQDRDGHAEMRWTGVSSQMCHTLVKSVYDYPSVHLGFEVDGHPQQVSCEGASHDILIYPKL